MYSLINPQPKKSSCTIKVTARTYFLLVVFLGVTVMLGIEPWEMTATGQIVWGMSGLAMAAIWIHLDLPPFRGRD